MMVVLLRREKGSVYVRTAASSIWLVLLFLSIYLVAVANPNKHIVAMYQKLSFSDFISFYNSKDRHLEFLNLSPQGLISSLYYECLK